jgi:Transmembrane secretion effector
VSTVELRRPSKGLRWLLGSTAAAVTAQGMVAAAAPLLASTLTRNPLAVGAVAASAWLPWLLVGLPAGALVERWPRRLVMVITDAARAMALLLFAGAVFEGATSLWLLAATILAVGVGSCFFDPAAQAEIPALAGQDASKVAEANARYWTVDTLGRTLVGGSAGALAFSLGAPLPFAVAGVLLLASALALARLPVHPAGSKAVAAGGLLTSVREGLTYLWGNGSLRRNAMMMGTYNLAWNLVFGTLILVLLAHFNISDWMWGLLVSSIAVGGALGGAWARHTTATVERAYGYGFAVQAVGWLLALLAPSTWATLPGFMLVGVASTAVSAVGGTGIQLATPDGLRARVTSGIRLVGIGAAAVGAGLSGPVAAVAGLAAPSVLAVALLVAAASWALSRR